VLNNILHQSIPILKDDGFSVTAAEPWFKVKVQLIQNYLQAFVTTAASQADEIVFIDLFAGSGLYSVGHQKEIFTGSSFTALTWDLPIDKYIFCEEDPDQSKALKIRAERYFKNKNNIIILEGHPEELVDKLIDQVPQHKGGYRTAVLCLVDPFSLDIPFNVIEKLAVAGFSFLMPFTFSLNERLNCHYYVNEQRSKLRRFAGTQAEKISETQSNVHFYKRLIKIYQHNMLMLGLNTTLSSHKLNSQLMELPMYYIGYFSKQISTKTIQREVQPSEQLQIELF
jgi:three-Cys-motif partner protein